MNARVLQATAWYAPYHVGGTEVYVEGLVAALAARGVSSTVVTPRAPGAPERYGHAGHAVETYRVGTMRPDELRGAAPHEGFEAFRRLLADHRGAIYHQHSWTRGLGLRHLEAARALGLRTVLTVHVPAVTCLRGTMLRFGAEPCGGHVEARACGACWAHGQGMPRSLAAAAARLPQAAAERLRRAPSRLATALANRAVGAEREAQLRAMIGNADRVVAVCRWLADALAANGVPPERLTLSRQGVPDAEAARSRADGAAPDPTGRSDGRLALLYLGRWDPVKGIDVLVRAVRAARADLRLTVRGVAQGERDEAYAARVRALAGSDPRIRFAPPVPRAEVAAELVRHDVLAVPSRWMETGPLVVLEARAAGLFVLGSRLGGIAELVAEDGDGELVEAGSVAAWARAIEGLAARRVRRGRPCAVRTMSDVAADMAALYGSL